jgi:peroxiredoxin
VAAAVFAVGAEGAFASEPATNLTAWSDGSKPAFVLEDTNRHELALNAQRGQVVLVHFFATWCEPCRDELPALRRLVERTSPAQLRVLAISVAEPDSRVRNFIDRTPVNFPVLLDRDRSVAKSWSVSALPTTFVLDRDLTPRLFVERDYDWDRFNIHELQTLPSKGGAQ